MEVKKYNPFDVVKPKGATPLVVETRLALPQPKPKSNPKLNLKLKVYL